MTAEDLLARSLHEVTEQTDYPSTPLATVATRAHVVRARRRRTAALAAAAAVAVVVTPGAIWLSRSPGTSPGPSHEATSGPTVTSTPPPVRLASIPAGSPPRIMYSGPRGYINEQGQVITFAHPQQPADAYVPTSFTPYDGGFLVVGSDGLLHQITSSGAQSVVGCASGDPAISADGVTNAWASKASCGARATTIHRGIPSGMGNGVDTQTIGHRVTVVGLLHESLVVSDVWPGHGGAWVSDLVHAPRPIPGLASAGGVDESHGLVAGQSTTSSGRDGVLVDASNGRVLWTAPGWQLGRFSTAGSFVAGYRQVDGGQVTRLGILDARTGRVVRTVDGLADPAVANPAEVTAWEDDHDLLVLTESLDQQAVVRVPVSGPMTRATSIQRIARPGDRIFAFGARP